MTKNRPTYQKYFIKLIKITIIKKTKKKKTNTEKTITNIYR